MGICNMEIVLKPDFLFLEELSGGEIGLLTQAWEKLFELDPPERIQLLMFTFKFPASKHYLYVSAAPFLSPIKISTSCRPHIVQTMAHLFNLEKSH